MHLPNKYRNVTSAHLLNTPISCIMKAKKGGNRMIKKMAITVTLILVCVLVFGCSANDKANDSKNIDFESEKISFNNEFEVKEGEENPSDDEPGKIVPDTEAYIVVLHPRTSITSYASDGTLIELEYTALPTGYTMSDVSFVVPDDYSTLSIAVYELGDGNWTKVTGRNFGMGNRESVRLINAPSLTTPYYDLYVDQTISVPLTFDGEDLELEAVLKKSGVRAITYLFANDFDTEKDVILGGYVVVSEQRRLLEEFNASYFDDPSTLPDLDENCEIFAITIELGK